MFSNQVPDSSIKIDLSVLKSLKTCVVPLKVHNMNRAYNMPVALEEKWQGIMNIVCRALVQKQNHRPGMMKEES